MIWIFFSITRRVVFPNAKHPKVYFGELFFSYGKNWVFTSEPAEGLVKFHLSVFRSSAAHAANRYATWETSRVCAQLCPDRSKRSVIVSYHQVCVHSTWTNFDPFPESWSFRLHTTVAF